MTLLYLSDYPAIRATLDVSLGDKSLPDAVIELPVYLGAAEAEVLRRYPASASATGVSLARYRNACMLLCASFLAGGMVAQTTSETLPGGGYRYDRPAVDWSKRAKELRARAEDELAPTTTTAKPDAWGLGSSEGFTW
jgi:hypothetical protein